MIGNPVPDSAHLLRVPSRAQHQYGHVTVGGGMFEAINIDKICPFESIPCSETAREKDSPVAKKNN